jgi:hypothetical protein
MSSHGNRSFAAVLVVVTILFKNQLRVACVYFVVHSSSNLGESALVIAITFAPIVARVCKVFVRSLSSVVGSSGRSYHVFLVGDTVCSLSSFLGSSE